MSDEAPQESGNRATVALVAEMVKGLRELTRSEFENVKQRIEPLAGLPVAFEKLAAKQESLEHRVTELEERDTRADERRRVHLPSLIVAVMFVVIALAGLVVQIANLH